MPNLREILGETLMFRAAEGFGKDLYSEALEPGTAIAQGEPRPNDMDDLDAAVIRGNAVWDFKSTQPSEFTNLRIRKRHGTKYMPHLHTVFTKIKFNQINVTTREGTTVRLPLEDKYLATMFSLDAGFVARMSGYWQLPHLTDRSRMYVLGYELRDGVLAPLTKDEMERLGDDLMPARESLLGRAIRVVPGTIVKVNLAPPRFIACVSVTCCKEKDDWEPGGLLGAARLFPHTMVVSNVDLAQVESSLLLVRPRTSMVHDDEMQADVRAMLFTDSGFAVIRPSIPA